MIPPPAFVSKPDAIWTEEERKQFRDYEKKVRELNEERDKYRKVRSTNNSYILHIQDFVLIYFQINCS